MSVKVMERVWKYSRAKGAARLVLLSIADHAHNDDGTEAWPGFARLMQRTGLSRSSIINSVGTLEGLNELVVIQRGSGKTTSRYRVTVDEPDEGSEIETGAESGPLTRDSPKRNVDPSPPNTDTPGVRNLHPRGPDSGPKPYLNPVVNPKEPSTSEEAARGAAASLTLRRNGDEVRPPRKTARERSPDMEARLARVREGRVADVVRARWKV